MPIGVVGRKRGMTRIFTEAGASVPVTVIEATPNRVTQVKSEQRDGYRAIQVAAGSIKPSRLTKAQAGHFARAGVDAGDMVMEFRLRDGEGEDLEAGSEVTVEQFAEGQAVDVSGVTIGKGFGGVIKRHHFHTQDATHGNSLAHRAPGSIGQNQTPGRVFKGKKMAGHMGNVNRTAVNLEVVRVDAKRNLILIKGAVPGAKGGEVVIRPSTRAG